MAEIFKGVREVPVKLSKTTEMWEMRGMLAGILIPGLFGISAAAYVIDKLGDKLLFDRDGNISKRVYGEDPSVWNDVKQAFSLRLLPSPRMARAAA